MSEYYNKCNSSVVFLKNEIFSKFFFFEENETFNLDPLDIYKSMYNIKDVDLPTALEDNNVIKVRFY